MRGKYSPTVIAAYMKDQNWFHRYSNGKQYDPAGYDSYGYDKDDVDRAGNRESYYYVDDLDSCGDSTGSNGRYDQAYIDWSFDGVKPVYRWLT